MRVVVDKWRTRGSQKKESGQFSGVGKFKLKLFCYCILIITMHLLDTLLDTSVMSFDVAG